MAHRVDRSNERALEALTRFSFPSSDATISSLFLDKVTLLETTAAKSEFSVGVCKVLLNLWARCLQESFVRLLLTHSCPRTLALTMVSLSL